MRPLVLLVGGIAVLCALVCVIFTWVLPAGLKRIEPLRTARFASPLGVLLFAALCTSASGLTVLTASSSGALGSGDYTAPVGATVTIAIAGGGGGGGPTNAGGRGASFSFSFLSTGKVFTVSTIATGGASSGSGSGGGGGATAVYSGSILLAAAAGGGGASQCTGGGDAGPPGGSGTSNDCPGNPANSGGAPGGQSGPVNAGWSTPWYSGGTGGGTFHVSFGGGGGGGGGGGNSVTIVQDGGVGWASGGSGSTTTLGDTNGGGGGAGFFGGGGGQFWYYTGPYTYAATGGSGGSSFINSSLVYWNGVIAYTSGGSSAQSGSSGRVLLTRISAPCPSGLVWSVSTGACTLSCPVGSYCQGGRALPCQAGYYGSSTGQTLPTCSGPCSGAPGFGCAEGSISATPALCATGYFCPGGTPALASRCVPSTACAVNGLSTQPPCFWKVSTVVGSGVSGLVNGVGSQVMVGSPSGMAVDASGAIFWGEQYGNVIRRLNASGTSTVFAGSNAYGGADGVGTAANFAAPHGMVADAGGTIYLADPWSQRVRIISPSAMVVTLAGNDARGAANGIGSAATFNLPTDVAVDNAGTVYVADAGNNLVRRISSAGAVTTIAGGEVGYRDGLGTSAAFNFPYGIEVDTSSGILYVGDTANNALRAIDSSGRVSTLAGSPSGACGFADGVGTLATFCAPRELRLGAINGGLVVTDADNNLIRSVSLGGEVSTLAGTGRSGGFSDGYGTLAAFSFPFGIAVDGTGAIVVADTSNFRIRRLQCVPCPTSYYCASGAPVQCPAGSYCPISSINPVVCPAGTFSIAGASLCTNCSCPLLCPAGSTLNVVSCSSTPSPTKTPSATSSATSTSSTTFTGTFSSSPSQTPSSTLTPTQTSSSTPSQTQTRSSTPTSSPTPSLTSSSSPTSSASPTKSQTSSISRSLSSTSTPLTCAPGTFVAPGTYACARCPAGSFSAASGPTTSCTSCAPLISTPNATSCAPCPPLQRSNASGSCEACPLGHFCDGTGADLFCQPPIDVCLGALQGCRAGHAGFMCASCAPGFFKSPSSYCTPCTSAFFLALPVILGSIVLVPLVFWLFSVCGSLAFLSPYAKKFREELSRYDITLAVLSDQLLRLSLLRRVASFQLPSVFGWLLGFVSLMFGFSTIGSGAECFDPSWSFLKNFVAVFGVGGALIAATLLFDLCTYRLAKGHKVREGTYIDFPSWRVWDTLAFFLPFAVQTSWEALTHLNINGQERLWNSPSTPWEPFSATSLVASCTIAFHFFFILFRFVMPCTLNVKRSINQDGKEVLGPENEKVLSSSSPPPSSIVTTSSISGASNTPIASLTVTHSPPGIEIGKLLYTPANMFRAARNLLAFLRSLAIPLQMHSTLAPALLLGTLSAVDLALAFSSRKALVSQLALLGRKASDFSTSPASSISPASDFWQATAWLLMLTVFSATHGAVIAMHFIPASFSHAGLGIALLLLNVLPFVAFLYLILRGVCFALASVEASAAPLDDIITPKPTSSNKHLLAESFGKPVLLVTATNSTALPLPPPPISPPQAQAWGAPAATFRGVSFNHAHGP